MHSSDNHNIAIPSIIRNVILNKWAKNEKALRHLIGHELTHSFSPNIFKIKGDLIIKDTGLEKNKIDFKNKRVLVHEWAFLNFEKVYGKDIGKMINDYLKAGVFIKNILKTKLSNEEFQKIKGIITTLESINKLDNSYERNSFIDAIKKKIA